MSDRKIVSYWAVPNETDAAAYQTVIYALAKAQGGVGFKPHLSLGSLAEHDPDLDDVREHLNGLCLIPTGIGRSDVFTQSLFVSFAASEGLLRARDSLASRSSFHSSRSFEPHISLCYGAPCDEDALHAEMAALLSRPVHFDRVWAVEIRLPVISHDEVQRWTPLAVFEI